MKRILIGIVAASVFTSGVGAANAEAEFVFRYRGKLPVSISVEEPEEEEPTKDLAYSATLTHQDSNENGVGDPGEFVIVSGTVTNNTSAAVDFWGATALAHGGYKTMSCDDWQIQPGASVSCELFTSINKAFYEDYEASPGQLLAFSAWVEFDTSEGVERIDAGQVAFEVPEFPEPTEQPAVSAVSFTPMGISYSDKDGSGTLTAGDTVTTHLSISNYNGDETFPIAKLRFRADYGGFLSTRYECGPIIQGATSVVCSTPYEITQADVCGIDPTMDGYGLSIKPTVWLEGIETQAGSIPANEFRTSNQQRTFWIDRSGC